MQVYGIDPTPILVALIAAGGAIFCKIMERRGVLPAGKPLSKWAVGMWAFGVTAAISIIIFGTQFLPPSVAIIYPSDHADAEQIEIVSGTSQRLPAGELIWVVVFIHEAGRYYPQNEPAIIEAKNNWSSRVSLGVPGEIDKNKKFDILAVGANPEAQSAFKVYLTGARDRSDSPGLGSLPTGATIYDRVTVTRK